MWKDWKKYMKNSAFFPLFVDISEKKIVVIGGGAIATRRVKTLLSFEPQIVVVAPEVTGELERFSTENIREKIFMMPGWCWLPPMIPN